MVGIFVRVIFLRYLVVDCWRFSSVSCVCDDFELCREKLFNYVRRLYCIFSFGGGYIFCRENCALYYKERGFWS